MPCLVPTNHLPLWECRAEEDKDKEDEIVARDDELVDINSTRISPLLNIPFDILKIIMELCVGVEYLNFRATCKQCKLTTPVIRWSNETSLRRLQTYSLPSPWLMVFDTHRDIITFTDPMFGDKYFMKTPQELIGDLRIHSSGYGWLLVYNLSHTPLSLMLFNPFTNDIRKLPPSGYIKSICFSAPPTSSDCMVAGFVSKSIFAVRFHFVNQSPDWDGFNVDFDEINPRSISFPTLYGRDVYVLEAGGRLDVYKIMEEDGSFWEVVAEAPGGCPSAAKCFLVKCEEHRLLLVRMDEYGESVEVFKLNQTTQEWERVDGLGRHMIYICDTACLCMEAKTPEMENKIYFPQLHSKNGKIVFYSLETCRYHTFNDRKLEEESLVDFLGTKSILSHHAWIEPSWC
ncbi:hypothetical protein L1987_86675 [Smallanthus sonchifolius]|uniref:Uncharacterized protein n=1 Tax=Smallanthus sonchifolius TaxID=185202 RepID=A0ACB8XZE9_9ASTR|nr:hypothetical protein L1987_86675 [Smallanthus sonchifolius]